MSGSEDMKPQSKEVTPSKEAQTIMPDEEYNCLSQVTVKAIDICSLLFAKNKRETGWTRTIDFGTLIVSRSPN